MPYKKSLIAIMLGIAIVLIAVSSRGDEDSVKFTAATSEPDINTFSSGHPVKLVFHANSGRPIDATPVVHIKIRDIHDNVIWDRLLSLKKNNKGSWIGEVSAPEKRLGFYKVSAFLSVGDKSYRLGERGTLPAGYLTYAVVPDPSKRPDLGARDAFFGLSAGLTDNIKDVIPLLGVRWVEGNLNWSSYEPQSPEPFNPRMARVKSRDGNSIFPFNISYDNKAWQVFPLPTLYAYSPKWIASMPWKERYVKWKAYCKAAALYFKQTYGNLPFRVYQTTWEPNFKWQFDGTKKQLVKWQKVAYEAIHSVDPEAVVIGPTGSSIRDNYLPWHYKMIKLGIWRYLDGFSIHPYTQHIPTLDGKEEALIQGLSNLKSKLREASGRNIPIYATESGLRADPNYSSEITQARYIVESSIIMYAMGVRLSFAFYVADYKKVPGFGLYYNDTPGVPPGAKTISPKPVVPAYSAMTYMLAGSNGAGRLDLGHGVYAFKFRKPHTKIIVIWSKGNSSSSIPIALNGNKAHVYDWMGNLEGIYSRADKLKVTEDPIYVEYDLNTKQSVRIKL